jgi:2,3-bisphosphoglycerate-independent phosphoglycerate mutase
LSFLGLGQEENNGQPAASDQSVPPNTKKVLLVILDGWGVAGNEKANGPLAAKTPILDYVYTAYPKTLLMASGIEVGIIPGEPGNSEVGHSNIGSGRIVWENLPKLNQMIESGELENSPVIVDAMRNVARNQSALHLIGLVSDGGVHSHIDHVNKLIEIAGKNKLAKVYVHFIADGRDTPPKKAQDFVGQLAAAFKKFGTGKIATIIGRYFAMDRDKNWDRSQKAVDLFTQNTGDQYPTAADALKANYQKAKTDEFIEPSVIGEGGKIQDKDSIIFFNYRNDRSRQLLAPFDQFQTKIDVKLQNFTRPNNLYVCTLVQYYSDTKIPKVTAPSPAESKNPLSEVVANAGLTQFHTAETEKFAHVTYFFDSGREVAFNGEKYDVAPSKKVKTYDLAPEMSASEVTEKVLAGLGEGHHFIVVNYANGDMVGHTGVWPAVVRACETVDSSLGKVLAAASPAGYQVIVTADHGNCDVMVDEITGEPHKEHTANPVPFVYLDFTKKPYAYKKKSHLKSQRRYLKYAATEPIGVLADIAPSVLALLGLTKPEDMGGMNIIASLSAESDAISSKRIPLRQGYEGREAQMSKLGTGEREDKDSKNPSLVTPHS